MDNTKHYDSITEAWQFILGQHFHWGYFKNENENLESATINLIDIMLEQLRPTKISNLIDIGCGIGNTSIYLHEKINCEVIGISNSPIGITKAKENINNRERDSSIEFFVRDATSNELKDESFDVSWLSEMSHLIEDKQKLIDESVRVLKKNGQIILCDLMFRRKLKAIEIFNSKDDLIKLEYSFGKAKIEEMSSYVKYFQNSKLKDIEIIDISDQVIPTPKYWKENVLANYNLISNCMPISSIDNFLYCCDLLYKYYNQGVWGYGIIIGTK